MPSLRLAAVLVLAIATPSFGQTTADKPAGDKPAATATADKKPPAEKLVCARETVAGSSIPKRVCRSQADVEALRDRAQRALLDERGTSKPDPGAAGAQ